MEACSFQSLGHRFPKVRDFDYFFIILERHILMLDFPIPESINIFFYKESYRLLVPFARTNTGRPVQSHISWVRAGPG
jgi:hypothetical protein